MWRSVKGWIIKEKMSVKELEGVLGDEFLREKKEHWEKKCWEEK